MPTNRTYRRRPRTPALDDFKRQQLLMGPESNLVPGRGYFRDNVRSATDEEHAAAREAMRADWHRHGPALVAWWVHETEDPAARSKFAPVERGGPGSRPWAWWEFAAHRRPGPGETEADCLDEVWAWRPGERDRWLAAG